MVSSLLKTQAVPEDIYSVDVPALNPNQCIIRDTRALSFKFTNSNMKSWFLNNLGRLLVDRLSIKAQDIEVYKTRAKACWKSTKICGDPTTTARTVKVMGSLTKMFENLSAATIVPIRQQKPHGVLDSTITRMCDRMKIPLGTILCDHGPYVPYGMCDFV